MSRKVMRSMLSGPAGQFRAAWVLPRTKQVARKGRQAVRVTRVSRHGAVRPKDKA